MAYARADRDGLLAVTSADFCWHQHCSNHSEDRPTGRVLSGVDAMIEEIRRRQVHWQNVRYENLVERATEDGLLVQTFTISGEEDGVPFHANAVDLYPVEHGRIVRKDTYWKYTAGV